MLRTTLEGQDVQHFKKGTSEAQGWVLSYYIKVDGEIHSLEHGGT